MSSALEHIKNNLTEDKVRMVLSSFGARSIEKMGNELRCTCCIHMGDNTTAFAWDLEKNLWCCFTGDCGGGDIFDLVSLKYDIPIEESFKQIIEMTAQILGIDIIGLEINDIKDRNMKDTRNFVRATLAKKSKKTNEEYNIRSLGTMYALKEYREFTADFLLENKVYFCKEQNRVLFTLLDENSKTIGASMRRVDEKDKAKWLHRPKGLQRGSMLYNLNNVKGKYGEVYIVEGIIDCLRLKSFGIENVVAILGSKITDEQMYLLMKYFYKIYLCLDNDKAGFIGTSKSIEICKNSFDIKVIDYTDINIKDVGELSTKEQFNEIKFIPVVVWEKQIRSV